MGKVKIVFLLYVLIMMVGCEHNMALYKNQKNLDISKKSIGLLSVNICNKRYEKQPYIQAVFTSFNSSTTYHNTVGAIEKEGDDSKDYLLSLEFDPGTNNINKIWAVYDSFVATGLASIPIDLNAEIKINSVNYLGHMDIIIRDKNNNDEKSAGSLYPYTLGNSIYGFLTGTYDVIVSDKYDNDIKMYMSRYPVLENINIEKAILPKWVRPEFK